MSFRALAAVAVITVAALSLFSPAADAAAPGTVQVTGIKLASALVPAAEFGPHFQAGVTFTSGGQLTHGPAVNKPAAMSCATFWALYISPGYGQTALAGDSVTGVDLTSPLLYGQAVYQMPTASAASALFTAENGAYGRCRSFTAGVPGSGNATVHVTQSVSETRVGGHQAFLVDQHQTYSDAPGIATTVHVLVTADGADVFIVTGIRDAPSAPTSPTLTSVIGKLIARTSALR
jgi:hypothetical protein